MIGERLFPRIADLAGKITGMLLEMDNAGLLLLLGVLKLRNRIPDGVNI
jgi:hypothetical protein